MLRARMRQQKRLQQRPQQSSCSGSRRTNTNNDAAWELATLPLRLDGLGCSAMQHCGDATFILQDIKRPERPQMSTPTSRGPFQTSRSNLRERSSPSASRPNVHLSATWPTGTWGEPRQAGRWHPRRRQQWKQWHLHQGNGESQDHPIVGHHASPS